MITDKKTGIFRIALVTAMTAMLTACAGNNAGVAGQTVQAAEVVQVVETAQSAEAAQVVETAQAAETAQTSGTSVQSADTTAQAAEAIDETQSTQEESSPEQPVQDQSAQEAKAFTPIIRIDRDDPKAAERDLENLRVITEGKYELEEPKAKYGIDPNFVPDLTGLDTLNVSASAQFTERQFRELAKTLRDVANGKEIYIFDLRRESHALLGGLPFSLYDLHNWSNGGLTLEQIEQSEKVIFGALSGTQFQAFVKDDDNRGKMALYQPGSMMTEQKLWRAKVFIT